MEVEEDYSFAVPLICTVLAVLLATLLVKLRKPPAQEAQEEEKETVEELREEKEEAREEAKSQETDTGIPVEEVGIVEELIQEEVKEGEKVPVDECSAQERRGSSHSSQDEEDSKSFSPLQEEDFDVESDKVLKISEADDADDESFQFQYVPGKLRGSEFEKMLTKEELEEEQRVKRDQLGAIFQMMERKQDTFGEMSEGDVMEQLKLYNM